MSHQVLLKPPPVPASHPSLEKSGSGSGEAGEVWGVPWAFPAQQTLKAQTMASCIQLLDCLALHPKPQCSAGPIRGGLEGRA